MTDPPPVTETEGEGTHPHPGGRVDPKPKAKAWGRLVAGLAAAGVEVDGVEAGSGLDLVDGTGARWLRLTWSEASGRWRGVEAIPFPAAGGRRAGRPAAVVDAERVRRLRAEGLSVRAVARACGVSSSTVQRIVTRVG
jgi:hypothetical protein